MKSACHPDWLFAKRDLVSREQYLFINKSSINDRNNLVEPVHFGRSPFLKKKGAGFPLQSFPR